MHSTIKKKKKLQLHTYMDSNYNLSLFYFILFLLISFGRWVQVTHGVTLQKLHIFQIVDF